MRDNKLHTPDGVRDYLFDEYAHKLETERKIASTFARYGYRAVSSPTLEYLDVFEENGSLPKGMYKFIDRDGEVLALRSDMTPPMVRIATTNYRAEELPLRFSYIGNVYRYRENYQGKLREFTQAGVELMGADTAEAGAEIIALAINSLLAAGLTDFKIFIGHVGFFRAALNEAGFTDKDIKHLSEFIIANNFVDYNRYIDRSAINDKETAKSLPLMIGDFGLLERVKSQFPDGKASDALTGLMDIYSKLCMYYGLGRYIQFDLGMVGFLDYYTDIIFRGYTFGTGFSILDGGRYRIPQYASFPSAGFAININDLLPAILRKGESIINSCEVTLLAFEDDMTESAYSIAEKLRSNGINIEISFTGGIQENIRYANMKHIKNLIYINNSTDTILADAETGELKSVSREQLLKEIRRAEV